MLFSMDSVSDRYELRNGYGIPCVGFGTFLIPKGEKTVEAVKAAVRAGFRHIDTAFIYENEESVGEGIREARSGIRNAATTRPSPRSSGPAPRWGSSIWTCT